MDKEKTIKSLNKFVEINNKRIEGYEKASENTKEKDLKSLFLKFEQSSKECLDELKDEINKLGGKVSKELTVYGKFFRTWEDVISALTGKDRHAILNACEYGEKQTNEIYQTVLEDDLEHLSPQHISMIKEHSNLLKTDQNTIESMQNNLLVTQ